uniref:RNB domain-containing protein n=1 Tax=viral metagenome TaxID=1070528 RepID=A0A6C0ER20_9ZZZZ
MIPGILRLNSKTKYGMTSRNVPIYLFNPLDKKYQPCIVGCSQKDVTSNVLALINVERWEENKLTRGNLIRIIGTCGDLKAEEEALLYQYSSSTWKRFSKETLKIPSFDGYTHITGFAFNVDPPGCTDIDDAIIVGDDEYIYIVIADVASWMIENPDIFKKASTIGQTLYNNGRIISPLLPIQDECSLLPDKKRHGIALRFKWNNSEISNLKFMKVSFVNSKSFTYESIYSTKYGSLLKEISSYIAKRDIIDSHEWISELMILYNCEVAKVLVNQKQGLLRTQNAPDIEKFELYTTLGADLEFLANKSALYTHALEGGKHWGLNKEYYCHSTSPIRRFADIVNQMVIREDSILPFDLETINTLATNAKKYERDVFFMNKILSTSSRVVNGIVLSDHRIWVSSWKRIITCKNSEPLGSSGILKYSLDMDQPSWKRKMVFRFEGINYQE